MVPPPFTTGTIWSIVSYIRAAVGAAEAVVGQEEGPFDSGSLVPFSPLLVGATVVMLSTSPLFSFYVLRQHQLYSPFSLAALTAAHFGAQAS
jgi:hypothetical protein